MGTPQFIQTPAGERLVVLSEQDYATLLEQAEDHHDIQAADAVRARVDAGEETFPSRVVEALLEGTAPVRVFREYRGLRAGELAERAGISQGYLSEIEASKKTGSLGVLKRIADALDVELSDLT
ncbi:helix-turn-helix domain-containing protein [Billgrantia gudaonensis]|uniref:Helix-turn-helix domain-containing protein n=1 Tax=Billgrantia gudaonensis TaxID=376427 RepID=A0A1G9DW27_9GAMM|nr:helix-turn-helix transcriptional regulator [Halomonas gudaonensis]SDK68030.1 Helix-turn-helix domain-containing protein [Halomonas gudaonensis]